MVITMIAVMVYTALNGVLYHVQQVTAAYGQTQNVADYWISGAGLDRSDCRVLEQIDGVARRAAPHYLGGPGAGQRGCAAAGVCRCGLGDQHALPGGRSTAGRREGDGGQRCLCRRQRPFRGGQLRDAADRHRPGPASADQRAGQKPGVPLPRQCDHADAGAGALWLRLLQPRRSERADGKQSL